MMRKNLIQFLFLVNIIIFLPLNLHSENLKPYFRLETDINVNPYVYDFLNQLDSLGLNGSIMGAVKLNQFALGLKVQENYYSFGNYLSSSNFYGAYSISRLTFDFYMNIKNFTELRFGLGGAVYKSAFEYNQTGYISKLEGGLSVLFDVALFFPQFRYLELEFYNRVDLFFSTDIVSPYYRGGIRLLINPYIKFFKIYIDAGIMPWIYRSEVINITTPIFVWSTGIKFDVTFDPLLSNEMNQIKDSYLAAKNKTKFEKERLEKERLEKERLAKEALEKDKWQKIIGPLQTAKPGNSITFENIIFEDNTINLLPDSYPILDKIAEVLEARPELKFAIIGYSNYLGNPALEFELSIKRAKALKDYLVSKKINEKRIKTSAKANIQLNQDKNTKIKPKIVFIIE